MSKNLETSSQSELFIRASISVALQENNVPVEYADRISKGIELNLTLLEEFHLINDVVHILDLGRDIAEMILTKVKEFIDETESANEELTTEHIIKTFTYNVVQLTDEEYEAGDVDDKIPENCVESHFIQTGEAVAPEDVSGEDDIGALLRRLMDRATEAK